MTKLKFFIQQELNKCNMKKLFECPKCKCYNESLKCIVCGTVLNSTHLKVLFKEEDFRLILQKAREELKKKVVYDISTEGNQEWVRWTDIEEILGGEK